MKKHYQYLIPLITVALGVIAGLLRRQQLVLGYDEENLLLPGEPSTVILLAVTVAFAIALIVLAVVLSKKLHPEEDILASSKLSTAMIMAGGALIAASGALAFFAQEETASYDNFTHILFMVSTFGDILAGISLLALGAGKLSGGKGTADVIIFVPIFCICAHLIYLYKNVSADPCILNYCFDLFAVILLDISLLAVSELAYGDRRPGLVLGVSLLGILMAVISIFEGNEFMQSLYLVGAAIIDFAIACGVLQNKQTD